MNKYIRPLDDFIKGLILGAFIVAAMIWFIVLLSGCSTHTITAPGVTATSTALLYCPEALVVRVDGKAVTMGAESAGVGTVVQSLGDNAVEVVR